MKKNVIIVLLVAGAVLLAGCQKGLFDGDKSSVRFTAVSSEVGTKTAYSGDVTTVDGKKYERINWKKNDVIRIWSDVAVHRYNEDQHWSDYIITADGTPHGRYSSASLAEMNMNNVPGDGTGNGLVWDAAGDYQFFAKYPAPESETVDGSGGVIPCYLPKAQNQTFTAGIGKPDMKLAYMTAAAKVKTEKDGEGTNVGLEFEPAFTAFEISIRSAGEAIGLTSFEMKSATKALTGQYDVKYTAGTSGYTKEIVPQTTGNTNSVYVSLANQEAPAASTGRDLQFTVFAIPQDYNDLSISFTNLDNITRTLQLKYSSTAAQHAGEGITFAAGHKHRIYGLVLPSGELLISVGTAPWLSGDESEYTTIEDASTWFESVKAYKNGQGLWKDTQIAIATGYNVVPIDPENPSAGNTNVPQRSPMFTLKTVSLPAELKLVSDNANVGLVYKKADGTYSDPVTELLISKSVVTDEYPYGAPVETTYFVVPLDGATVGTRAGISLIRMDNGVPVAYTHQDLPGSSDHTKILFQVVSEAVYDNNTDIEILTPSL